MRTRMQEDNGIYTDTNDPDHEDHMAKIGAIPWWLRGPADSKVEFFKGQKRRNDGTYRNAGGFLKLAREIYIASGWNGKFSFKNVRTGQPLHVCAHSVAMYGVCSRVFSCVRTQLFARAYSVVCKRVAVVTATQPCL